MERSVCALLASSAPLVMAQTVPVNTPSQTEPVQYAEVSTLSDVVVVGVRASLASALYLKQNKYELVDSVVADDITKLPDFSVTDALQRVTGVQIARDRGDGAGVTIRGLTQMQTTLNGQEVFTAGSGRNFDFADMASELLAGIDVYKTSSAEHIEGGLGGLINLRTRRPFDFKGQEIVATARTVYGDLVDRNTQQFSVLASNRWKTATSGEFGAMVNIAYQDRAFREDQKSTGAPRTDLIPGQALIAPNGTSETVSLGNRKRSTAEVVLQWRPAANLELHAAGSYTEFETRQNSYQINAQASRAFVPGSLSLFPGTQDVSDITWENAPVSILSFARDTLDRTKQVSAGGIWSGQALTLKSDLSYTKSSNTLFFSGLTLGGMASNFTQALSSSIPGSDISGTNLADPANLSYAANAYRARAFDGDHFTARLDGEYELSSGWINTVQAGLRYARRGASNAAGLIFADAPIQGLSVTTMPQFVQPNPYDFFPGTDSLRNTLVGNLDGARDAETFRQTFGVTAPIPTTANPLSLWDISEETQAAYLMGKFTLNTDPSHTLDGNMGLRVVQTHERVSGFQSVPATHTVAPIRIDSRYTDYLPSANLRYLLSPGLFLRAAASQTLTRPNFDQLSPSLTLLPHSIDPSLNQGGAGNPALQPMRSDNLDVAVERYFNKNTAIHLTGFLKKVDGFVTTVSAREHVHGVAYQISRPHNSDKADIKGMELGYQQFYDFLPGWMSGLGLQANYTYVDSSTFDRTLREEVPLQNLSKHSLNLVGMYEKGRVSARMAYNWRDRFLSGVTKLVGVGALPIYTQAYGWLDASVSYRFNDKTSLIIAGTNLLGTVRSSYFGVATRPQSSYSNDRQVSIAVTARF